jgi:hypothetical protein
MKVWYWHDHPEEETVPLGVLNQTRQYLMDIVQERGLDLGDTAKIHPAKLAHMVFIKLAPELET